MGMKEIDNTIKIVDAKEAKILDKNTNVSIFSELGNKKYLIKYSGKVEANLKRLYKNNPQKLTDLGLNKIKTVPSAVHIASAISAYARVLINEYKNIPGNPCIMSYTDSVVLPYPLPDHLVGRELGQMKLEHEIKEGIFIRKKFYYLLTPEGKEIIKASGIDSNKLDYYSFVKLLEGKSLQIERTV